MFRPFLLVAAAGVLLACLLPVPAGAGSRAACDLTRELAEHPPLVNLYLENDLFADQDQGYTNGARISMVSPNVRDFGDSPCLPGAAEDINRLIDILLPPVVPGAKDRQDTEFNMVFTLAQQMYTPTDHTRADLVEEDRPYAGWLYLGFGYNARRGHSMYSTVLNLGMVGPASLAEKTQDFVHRLRGIPRFAGWEHQLGNELGLQLVHERKRRLLPASSRLREAPWAWDAIVHWGGSVGNVATYANAGVEWRFGLRLPDDFGTSSLRPGGENAAPVRPGGSRSEGYGAHLFLSLDARLVARDIFLDGNTFRSSHSVDRRPWVADAALGVAFRTDRLSVTFARYVRTREFEGQGERPGYGAVYLSTNW